MVHPNGFEEQGKEHLVCRLKKALYGLKQAQRAWHSKIDAYFCMNGFERSPSEPNLFVKISDEGDIVISILYADDLIIVGNDEE